MVSLKNWKSVERYDYIACIHYMLDYGEKVVETFKMRFPAEVNDEIDNVQISYLLDTNAFVTSTPLGTTTTSGVATPDRLTSMKSESDVPKKFVAVTSNA